MLDSNTSFCCPSCTFWTNVSQSILKMHPRLTSVITMRYNKLECGLSDVRKQKGNHNTVVLDAHIVGVPTAG
jgi:hypothetical protein